MRGPGRVLEEYERSRAAQRDSAFRVPGTGATCSSTIGASPKVDADTIACRCAGLRWCGVTVLCDGKSDETFHNFVRYRTDKPAWVRDIRVEVYSVVALSALELG